MSPGHYLLVRKTGLIKALKKGKQYEQSIDNSEG
jgi:hypothetical protein